MKRLIWSCVFGMTIYGVAAYAHHSIAGVYDGSRQVTVEGIVVQFHFVNPHPFVTLDVKNASGNSTQQWQQWRLEMDNRWELAEVGMTEDTLKQGDRVVVSGSPGRTQSQSLYIRRLDRPADGFRYEQVGTSPRIRVPAKPAPHAD